MRPKLEKITSDLSASIAVKREICPYMDYPWHYHPEFEIIFVEKSYGIRLMGNHIGNFNDGDLMFISPNLPHVWKNDNDFYKGDNNLFVDVYVIQFREDALGDGFFKLPELSYLRDLFYLGQQGILIKGENHKKISELIKAVYNSSGFERLIFFLKTLNTFAHTKEYFLLSTPGYLNSVDNVDAEKINLVINFIMKNYYKQIKLEEVASLTNLTKTSFCRYFKDHTHKTFSHFLNEIRIAQACKLLINNDMSVAEVCYETGYNNISHFNRQFQLLTEMNAREYRKKYMKSAYSEEGHSQLVETYEYF